MLIGSDTISPSTPGRAISERTRSQPVPADRHEVDLLIRPGRPVPFTSTSPVSSSPSTAATPPPDDTGPGQPSAPPTPPPDEIRWPDGPSTPGSAPHKGFDWAVSGAAGRSSGRAWSAVH